MDAQQFPIISLGGPRSALPDSPIREYPIKFRRHDLIVLKREHGIDVMSPGIKNALDAIHHTACLLSVGVAHVQAISVPDMLDLMDMSLIGEYSTKANEALLKVVAQLSSHIPPAQRPPVQ